MKLTSAQKQASKPMPPFIRPLRDAIRAGKKKQTRRLAGLGKINERPEGWRYDGTNIHGDHLFTDIRGLTAGHDPQHCIHVIKCPYGKLGEIRYLREPIYNFNLLATYQDDDKSLHATSGDLIRWRWKNKALSQLHLPKIHARTFLKMKSIRCERIQDISEKDAKAEATYLAIDKILTPNPDKTHITFKECFQVVWKTINGRESWDKNPFCWVLTFSIIKEK